MFTINVPERMIAEKPNNLSYLENLAWDYFFRDKGWYIFLMDDAEGFLIVDDTANLEHAFFQCEMTSVRFWLWESASMLIENNMIETVELETYSAMFSDYENFIENENYDDTVRVFEVSLKWLKSFPDMNVAKFLEEYTWDDTENIYNISLLANEIISEKIVER